MLTIASGELEYQILLYTKTEWLGPERERVLNISLPHLKFTLDKQKSEIYSKKSVLIEHS